MRNLLFIFIILLFACNKEITKDSEFDSTKYETHLYIIKNKSPELYGNKDIQSLNEMIQQNGHLLKEFESKSYGEVIPLLVSKYDDWKKEQKLKELEDFKKQLEREVESAKSFDGKTFRNDVTSIQLEVAIFKVWKDLYNKSQKSKDSEIMKMGKELKKHAIQVQKKEFPLLRKNYSEVANKLLWENDIEAKISGGNKYTTINFTGGIFASNKNIKDMQNEISEILSHLRFKRSTYKWYKGQDDYTYYDLKTKKDEEF